MNFTKAAEILHITQPAVSQHIHGLERQYDAQFFYYKGKQLTLTEAGRLFLQTAATMRHDAIYLKDSIHQLGSKRPLRFGATLTVAQYVMPGPLGRLLQKEPDRKLQMQAANTSELLTLLNQGEIDFAIVEGFFAKQAYDSLPFDTAKYYPVCSPSYFQGALPVTAEELLNERLLVREAGSGTRQVLERALEDRNLTLEDFRRTAELGSLETIKTLVSMGAGISFFYEPVIKRELSEGSLIPIPLKGFPILHDFTFLWRKNSVFGDEYKKIYEFLKKG